VFSTLLIVGGLSFLLLKKEWNVMTQIKNEIVQVINNSHSLELGNEKDKLFKNSMSFYVLDSDNKVLEIVGFGDFKYYSKNFKFKQYSFIQIQNRSVFLSTLHFIKIDKEYFQIIFHKNVDTELRFIIHFLFIVVSAQLLAMIFTFFRGIKTNKRVLKPIHEMTKITQKISANSLNLRINVTGIQDELKELS